MTKASLNISLPEASIATIEQARVSLRDIVSNLRPARVSLVRNEKLAAGQGCTIAERKAETSKSLMALLNALIDAPLNAETVFTLQVWASECLADLATIRTWAQLNAHGETFGHNEIIGVLLGQVREVRDLVRAAKLERTVLALPCTDSEIICAVPYGYDLPAFYFSNEEEYNTKLEAAKFIDRVRNCCGDYEHSLEFIDGEGSQEMLDSCRELEDYFEMAERLASMSGYEQAALAYLIENNQLSFADAIEKYEEVMVTDEAPDSLAYEYAEECLGLSGAALQYFNAESFARDCMLNGDWNTFRHAGTTYTIQNAASL
ncbi:antirestriction protein ArdA [Parendozoicomonas haliclonae]|uniref:Uncharacterized protein n=1 Tax=Parendozoicomonas haliclonae TaxID=1960125 RepID=A0A1X7AMJ4_9GAMM|nr:antirestriction protein ArdA [Parendozoicomonas haliclonae]SMA47383.1 hypothetical protein EHSB41UT_02397 [Parendozoicomonas haliclonae]